MGRTAGSPSAGTKVLSCKGCQVLKKPMPPFFFYMKKCEPKPLLHLYQTCCPISPSGNPICNQACCPTSPSGNPVHSQQNNEVSNVRKHLWCHHFLIFVQLHGAQVGRRRPGDGGALPRTQRSLHNRGGGDKQQVAG